MKNRKIITYKNDYYFPFQLRMMAWLGIIMGIALIVGGSIVFGIILFPLSLFFGLAKAGVQIDLTNSEFRHLPFNLSKNSGWKPLSNYLYITTIETQTKNYPYGMYLTDKNRQEKLLLQRFEVMAAAQPEMKVLASNLRLINYTQGAKFN